MFTRRPLATTTFTTSAFCKYGATGRAASAAASMSASDASWDTRIRAAHLSVDLHRHLDQVFAGRRLVERRPSGGDDTARVAEPFPELLGQVRRERRQHQHERLDTLRAARPRFPTREMTAGGSSSRPIGRRPRGSANA